VNGKLADDAALAPIFEAVKHSTRALRGRPSIRRRVGIALFAFEHPAQHLFAPRPGLRPGTIDPRRLMTDMLAMSAFEFRHPVIFVVEMKACHRLFHNVAPRYPVESGSFIIMEQFNR
jgi:hypothetical protein